MIIKVKVHRELLYKTNDYYFYCESVRSAFKTAYHHLRVMRNLMIDFNTPGTMEAEFTYDENTIILKLNAFREIAYRRGSDVYWTPLISEEIPIPLNTRIQFELYHTRRLSHGKTQA